MNKWGYVSLGTSTIYEKEALEKADIVILEVNENIPFTHGDAIVHISEVDLVVENHVPMIEVPLATPNEKDKIIARYISDLVPDGATLQLGIGGVPAAVATYLTDKKNLGVHTELLVDSYVDLWEAGVVTNLDKTLEKGKMIGCLAIGTKKLWNFMDHNPIVELRKGSFTNSVPIMSQNTKLISINMTMQADFYGQCASESLGAVQYSATGGQLDWVRGAQLSPGGKSIICFYSAAKNDTISKIVPAISDGSAITTPRADIDYVVTEYGVAHLKGKPFSERAKLMIQIAHPKFRDQLEEEAKRLRIIR
jgi:Acetyl-CoA hydrolase